jgi:spore maturation protein CgeB
VLADPKLAQGLARRGRRTILTRHTCAHRVDELLAILRSLGVRSLKPVRSEEAAA